MVLTFLLYTTTTNKAIFWVNIPGNIQYNFIAGHWALQPSKLKLLRKNFLLQHSERAFASNSMDELELRSGNATYKTIELLHPPSKTLIPKSPVFALLLNRTSANHKLLVHTYSYCRSWKSTTSRRWRPKEKQLLVLEMANMIVQVFIQI